ncbi:efflux RND transporter periplasmic adaptor subunit [Methylomagnum ishizawai]|uniref:efflux RND transporter periplasmic adaptor subunit n=1 Tax=Methylomagnum ishizawai TaxID=1760988 RepID=UPI0015944692|nr:efflux RND transporter periplasmic adaptor subunit [Methylomagnum ishizawai]
MLILHAPVSGEEDAAAVPVETDVAVELGHIARMTLRAYVTAYGAVEAEPAQGGKPPASAWVAAPLAGLVAEARCEEGQRVQRGQALFSLDHRLADMQVEKARLAVVLAERNLRRKRSLSPDDNISPKLLDEAEHLWETARQDLAQAQVQRSLLDIVAPLGGTVVRVNVRPGEAVGGNAPVAEIVDLDRLVVNAAVPGAEAQPVRIGQPTALSVATGTGSGTKTDATPSSAPGLVAFIGLQIDPKTATVPVRIALPPGSGVRPGQFVQARIAVEVRPDRLAVPLESVVTRDGESAVFVVEGDRARRVPVRFGLRDGDAVEVEGEGLREGLEIVTVGAFGLPDNTRIHAIAR